MHTMTTFLLRLHVFSRFRARSYLLELLRFRHLERPMVAIVCLSCASLSPFVEVVQELFRLSTFMGGQIFNVIYLVF